MIPIIHCLLFDGLAFMVRIDLPVDWEHYKYIAYSVSGSRSSKDKKNGHKTVKTKSQHSFGPFKDIPKVCQMAKTQTKNSRFKEQNYNRNKKKN